MRNVSAPEIDVWAVSTRDFVHVDWARCVIGEGERTRASGMRTQSEQDTFTRGYATMRMFLAEYLSLQPAALRFGRGQYGKPFLLGQQDIHFNWTHAGEYWLLAVSFAGLVGIDVEKIRTDFDWRGPADVAFHPWELQYIERGDGTADRRFFELWARKEAAFKGIGTGLHDDMAGTTVIDDFGALKVGVDMLDGTCWKTDTIKVADGYIAALAARFPAPAIRVRSHAPSVRPDDRAADRPAPAIRLHHFRPEIVA